MLLIAGMLWGIAQGIKVGSQYGPWMTVCGVIIGAIAGPLTVILGLLLVITIFCFITMIKRMLEPADLVCRCQELGTPAPEHLIADTPIKQEAITESYKLMEWPEFARIRNTEPLTADILRARLAEGVLSQERIALAASLGNAAADELGITPVEPVLSYKSGIKIPKDIHKVLQVWFAAATLCCLGVVMCRASFTDIRERISSGYTTKTEIRYRTACLERK